MSKNISKFKIIFGIIIFCISIIALILSCLVYTKEKPPKIFTGPAGIVDKKGLGVICSANNDCESGFCDSYLQASVCMQPKVEDSPYINVGDPIFIKSKNTNEDLWINSKSDPLLTTCKNLKGSAGLTISYGWPACTDQGTKSTVTIGSDGFRTGEGCQVMATPYCVDSIMPAESQMCNLLTQQKRRLFKYVPTVAPPGNKITITPEKITFNFLWTLTVTWAASSSTNPPLSSVFWNWPNTWRSRNNKPFAGVWVRVMPQNKALNCLIQTLKECTCTDINCWECRKKKLGDPCQVPPDSGLASCAVSTSGDCSVGTYDEMSGWADASASDWSVLWNPKNPGKVSDMPLKKYCSVQLDMVIDTWITMIFEDFETSPGMTRITTTGLYPFSQIWAHICQHAGIAIAFPMNFDSFTNKQEYFREYSCMGGGKSGGGGGGGKSGGGGDRIPFGGWTTGFGEWMLYYAKTTFQGIGDLFLTTEKFTKFFLKMCMQKHAPLLQEITKIYEMIDEFFKEIGDASIHWTGDADLQSWLIQQEQTYYNLYTTFTKTLGSILDENFSTFYDNVNIWCWWKTIKSSTVHCMGKI